jgi:hypothetical protein
MKWPQGNTLDLIRNRFNQMGFPDTIRGIVGTYIKILLPKENQMYYICRKKIPAIILCVCDYQLMFTHCYAEEVGLNHDARVLRRSEIWTYLNRLKKL